MAHVGLYREQYKRLTDAYVQVAHSMFFQLRVDKSAAILYSPLAAKLSFLLKEFFPDACRANQSAFPRRIVSPLW
jgi:hypothetical protein